ncbi:hypothetical protein JCM8208_002440 [Rhodotorula glutinis]
MAVSNAYLAYGITVTTESLLYALEAWPALQGPFAFFDLVALRKRKRTLVAAGSSGPSCSAIEQVPLEIWGIVRHKVVDLELRVAEINHVGSLLCDECRDVGLHPEDLSWADVKEQCGSDAVWDFRGLGSGDRHLVAENLLSAFRLALPTRVPIRPDTAAVNLPWSPYGDPDTATLISLPGPAPLGASTFGLHARCGDNRSPDQQVIVDVSFSVPSDAKERFFRLVSTMHLQAVYVSDGMLANAGTSTAERVKELRREERKFKRIPADAIKPRWKFMTMAKSIVW